MLLLLLQLLLLLVGLEMIVEVADEGGTRVLRFR